MPDIIAAYIAIIISIILSIIYTSKQFILNQLIIKYFTSFLENVTSFKFHEFGTESGIDYIFCYYIAETLT